MKDHRSLRLNEQFKREISAILARKVRDPRVGHLLVTEAVVTSDLWVAAAGRALEAAGVEKDEVDLVVFATMTPDHFFPGCGTLLQDKLGLRPVPCFDIRQQCSGFLYALDLADALISSGKAETVAVIGAEVHAGYLPWGDTWDIVLGRSDREPTPEEYAVNTEHRAWSVLFGDGAGAMVLQRSAWKALKQTRL